MIDTGIHIGWLMESHTRAMAEVNRTWGWIRRTPAWQAWLDAHVPEELFVLVNFEPRERFRTVVREGSLTGYVPASYVLAAAEAHNLANFAAEVFRDLYLAFARKRSLPPPPPLPELSEMPSRLP